jgi:hypothetical protein
MIYVMLFVTASVCLADVQNSLKDFSCLGIRVRQNKTRKRETERTNIRRKEERKNERERFSAAEPRNKSYTS